MEATWPAASVRRAGPWLVREGRGAGRRASCATACAQWVEQDVALAEAAQEELGQPPIFMIRDGEDHLDAALAARGYRIDAPVALLAAPVAALAELSLPPVSAFAVWPPLAIQREIWAEGGIGLARQAVMDRAPEPKAAILGRSDDRPAGAAFVALAGAEAVVHAVHVRPDMRRRGTARHIMTAAARWAVENGAERLSLAVERANAPALALYASLGMAIVGQYHYRVK